MTFDEELDAIGRRFVRLVDRQGVWLGDLAQNPGVAERAYYVTATDFGWTIAVRDIDKEGLLTGGEGRPIGDTGVDNRRSLYDQLKACCEILSYTAMLRVPR